LREPKSNQRIMVMNLKMKAVCFVATVTFTIAGLSKSVQAAQAGVSDTQIVIGQTISYGEKANPYATAASMGIRLYIDKVNASGGIDGRKIILNTIDDQAKPELAEANARALVKQGIFLLFAPLEGGPAVAVAKVAEEAGVVLFAPMAGAPALTQPSRPLVFPVRASHRTEFEKLLDYAQVMGLKRVAFFRADTATGKAHAENMRNAVKRTTRELVAELPYKDDFTDQQIDTLVAKAKDSGAEIIINHGSPRLYERFILRSNAAKYKPNFFAVNSGSSEIAKRLGPDARGVIFSQITPNPESGKFAAVREFQIDWRKAYPQAQFSHGALEGYLSAKALAIGLKRASSNLTTSNFIARLHSGKIDLGGLELNYTPEVHHGMHYVDLSIVRSDGSFSY